MEIFYWVRGILSVGLLIYLVVALLKPDRMSFKPADQGHEHGHACRD